MMASGFNHDDRISIISMLINYGATVNQQSSNNRATALHVAAKKGAVDAIQFLLRKGADPTLKDCKGKEIFREFPTIF